ncbi:acyltransferase [Raoultella sp. RLT01]|uniref:acyltransferase family protein n=1 Tax=Raoultella sp. RLT01 TaxID=2769256 RepID=UPI001783841F|nr:acyltransferase [Raoultella sp. RLT01]MBD9719533.1 acyltransferase [Raoultella sp. RLT01]
MIISVQFLRAIAALFVVASHISLKGQQYALDSFQWFHIGGSGVDLFFIISGFIMCYTTHNKNISFIKFIFARCKRILPLYWLMTLLALMVYVIAPGLVNSSGGQTSIFASFTLIPNGDKYLVQNGWTLSYEFLFYFIFGFSLIFKNKKLIVCSLLIVILVTIGLFLRKESVELTPLFDFFTDSILLEFIFGIICFCIYTKISISYVKSLTLVSIGSLLMFYQNQYGFINTGIGRTLHSGLPMLLVFLGAIGLEPLLRINKNNLISKIGVLLGDASYSIYLTHPFVLSPVAIIGKHFGLLTSPLIFSAVLLFSSCLVGVFVYLYIEKPLHNYIKTRLSLSKPASV